MSFLSNDAKTNDNSESSFGVSNYDQKVIMSEKLQETDMGFDDVAEIGNYLRDFVIKDIPKTALNTFKIVKTSLTPGFINRMQQKKIHVKQVESTEQALKDVQLDAADMMQKELAHKRAVKEQDQIIKELLSAKKHIRDEVKVVLQAAESEEIESQFRDYHRRRDLQLAELTATIANEKRQVQEAAERERLSKRMWNISFFGDQAIKMKLEAAGRSEEKVRELRNKENLDRTFDEFESHMHERTRLQVDGVAEVSGKIMLPGGNELSLFGGSSEMRRSVAGQQLAEADDLLLEDVDQHEVHLFTSTPHTSYEDANNRVMSEQACVAQQKELYAALVLESSALVQSVEQMHDMRELLERDQRQIVQEILVTEKEQQGPPRRLPLAHEIPATDVWKTRASVINKRLNDLQYSIDKAESKKKSVDAQALSVAHQIAIRQDALHGLEQSVDAVNGGLGSLPMVVGTGIAKVPGLSVLTARPKEALDAIVHQSRLVDMRQQSEEAAQLHKDRSSIDQSIWLARLQESGKQSDVESVISRLVNISDRLQKSQVVTARQNIVDSLRGFFGSDLSLHPVRRKLMGMLPWFKHHDYQLSHCVARYVSSNAMGGLSFELPTTSADGAAVADHVEACSNGVTLGNDRSGFCCGTIELPKTSLWSILITVSKQYLNKPSVDDPCNSIAPESAPSDPTDFVTVKMGPTVASLSVVGTFFNRVNPVTGTVLYDVRHIFRGSSFAFRFDFSSSSPEQEAHLAVCAGIYEEYEMKALEAVDDPRSKSRQRVLSSYVKMLRINESTGNLRETKLLEELIAIEGNPKVTVWDSAVISQTLQRYSREYFLRILRAEILLQQETGKVAMVQRQQELLANRGLMADADLEREALLEASMKRYIAKKRAVQRKLLDEGEDMVGRRILLWDPEAHRWRNITVMECHVKWVENGLVALVTHVIQEYDDGHEALGDSMEVNLKSFKYFESPIQVVDAQAVARWKEQKRWTDTLAAINQHSTEEVQRCQNAFDKTRKKLERRLKRSRRVSTDLFESSIDVQATQVAAKPVAQRAIRVLVDEVLLDMKKGIVQVDELVRAAERKQMAAVMAKERFIASYIKEKRDELNLQLLQRESDTQRLVNTASEEFVAKREKIMASAEVEREAIRRLVRAQLAKRKKVLLQKVKFDPMVFRLAAPQSVNCEHLKTKAWGNNYGKGVKCLQCGKELSELFKEESQLLGYGSGTDPAMHEALVRHRQNEQSFRFKSSQELHAVEVERRRLEKERREMDESECYFYDLQDLRAIYDFDHRHARSIKQHGIFRQGLQWTEDELAFFEETRRIREKTRLEKEGLPESLLEQYDPLAFIEEPPPTLRAADERRRAQYNELLFAIGRLHNFSRRINGFKMVRFELLSEREMFALVLESLHKDSYQFEAQLSELERDLDKTSKLMATFRSMQLLWQQANHIQNQAKRDKLKAEMARCGVWEAVRECQDVASMIKDETRSLLRVKLLMDAKLDNQLKTTQFRRQQYEASRLKHLEKEQHLSALMYCAPGRLVYTRYGQCYICYYRQTDDMLMVTLPFGKPAAKAYIHYKEVVALERSKQQAEALLMGAEDAATSAFQVAERIQLKKERYAMQRAELGVREYYEFVDLGKHETSALHESITVAVDTAFAISETRKFRKLLGHHVKTAFDKIYQKRLARHTEYIGPPSGRPLKMSSWECWQQRRKIAVELKQKFVLQAATKAESTAMAELHCTRSAWVQTYAFQQLIDGVIGDMIVELAAEAHSEGCVAKGFAERKSGIMFPQPVWMQYGTYNSLATIWRSRKDELRKRIEMNRGQSAKILSADPSTSKPKIKLEPDELLRLKEAKRLKKLEKDRQQVLCAEMMREEILCRNFYRWELLENLRERRTMREEDRAALQLRKDEEKARVEAEAEAAYSGVAAKPGQTMSHTMAGALGGKNLGYDRRRQELKELTLERRRRSEDQAFMALEDKLGELLREVDRLERQKKAYEAEFGADDDSSEDGELVNTVSIKKSAKKSGSKKRKGKEEFTGTGRSIKQNSMKIPAWLVLPAAFKDWDALRQNKFVRLMTQVRIKTKQAEKKCQREVRRLERMERKSYKEWADRFKVAEQAQLESELAMMEADEDVKDAEARLIDVKENMMRILIFCREKGEEELHSRSELKRLTETARKRDTELKDATAWLDLCVRRSKNRDKLKRRVSSDCKWVDTDTINGFHQRFATERLREKLYYTYFRQIVASIVNRAEIIATERNLMNLQEKLSQNKDKIVDRTSAMKNLLVDIRRDERMRMRRSFLNEKFFGRSRRKVLQERFGGWVRYFLWNRGHKEAFQLKYEVIKRQMDIDRLFREQLRGNSAAAVQAQVPPSNPPTIMQKHRERVVQCKSCMKCYLEGQNTSISCQYHPKQFVLECPRTCPNPGLTDLCVAHRKRRWTCCDAVRQDAAGCSRRHHLPGESDPVYDKIMAAVNQRDRDMLVSLESQWQEAMQHDWPSKAHLAKRDQIFDLEDNLAKSRSTADRFKDLKFV